LVILTNLLRLDRLKSEVCFTRPMSDVGHIRHVAGGGVISPLDPPTALEVRGFLPPILGMEEKLKKKLEMLGKA